MNGRELARFLRALSALVETMNAEEIDQLPARLLKMRSNVGTRNKTRSNIGTQKETTRNPIPEKTIGQENLTRVLADLRATPSRETGYSVLDSNGFTRTELTNLARLADINITKSDDIERIREKIVESVVGSRLNSLAIRGDVS